MPHDRRVFGCAQCVSYGESTCDVRLSPRASLERAFERYHPVRGADPCRDPLHDRIHRRREIRVLEAVPHADERDPLHPRQRDRRGGLGRARARARHPHGAQHFPARVLADGGLRRMGGRVEDPGHHPALFPVLPLRRHVGKRRASLLVAHAERVSCVRRTVHLLLCFDHPAGALFPHDVHAEPEKLSDHAGRVAFGGQKRGADAVYVGAHFAAHLLHDRADGIARRQAAEAPLRRTEPFAEASFEAHRARKAQEDAEAKRRPVYAFAGVGGRAL